MMYCDDMNRILSSLLIVSMLSTSIPAWADGPPAQIVVPPSPVITAPAPLPIISPVQKGQPSPFGGILFSPEAIAKVIAKTDEAAALSKLAVQKQAEDDAARLKFQTDTLTSKCKEDKGDLQAQVDDEKRQITILDDQLKKATAPHLSGGTWFGIGVAGGVAVTVLTVVLLSKAGL